jgi:hypothetical protein
MANIFLYENGTTMRVPGDGERNAILQARSRDGQRGWLLNVDKPLQRGGNVLEAEPVNNPVAHLETAVRRARRLGGNSVTRIVNG